MIEDLDFRFKISDLGFKVCDLGFCGIVSKNTWYICFYLT